VLPEHSPNPELRVSWPAFRQLGFPPLPRTPPGWALAPPFGIPDPPAAPCGPTNQGPPSRRTVSVATASRAPGPVDPRDLGRELDRCLARCPPSFGGTCSGFFSWKEKFRAAMGRTDAWADDGTLALTIFRGAVCGTLGNWVRRHPAHVSAAVRNTETVGEGLESLLDLVQALLGVSEEDLQRQYREAWD
jgi:hypothetical protein